MTMGLPSPNESNDKIFIDFSNHTVKETIKGEEQDSLWPYSEISKTHFSNIYTLLVPNGRKVSNNEIVKGYSNDWNFKAKTLKEKSIVYYYYYKDNIVKFIKGVISFVF